MDWRTKCLDGQFSDKWENMKANLIPRLKRQATLRGFAGFCDDLYRDSDMTVDEYCFVPQYKK
jgi:hypothetical protein